MQESYPNGDLSGRVALVTGGGRNIGRAIALELASRGADIAILVRSNRAEAEAVAGEIASLGRRAFAGTADVRNADAVEASLAQAREQLGPVTILVNNAAVRRETPFAELPLADWHEILSIVLDGAFVCSQACLPDMLDESWGRIINIAGLTAQSGATHRAHVVTAKAGLIGLTKALALEYASENITVNAVSPGMIDTTRGGGSSPAEPRHHSERAVPVGRRGTPEEVAAMVGYLTSPPAAFVTGQTLGINGGLHL